MKRLVINISIFLSLLLFVFAKTNSNSNLIVTEVKVSGIVKIKLGNAFDGTYFNFENEYYDLFLNKSAINGLINKSNIGNEFDKFKYDDSDEFMRFDSTVSLEYSSAINNIGKNVILNNNFYRDINYNENCSYYIYFNFYGTLILLENIDLRKIVWREPSEFEDYCPPYEYLFKSKAFVYRTLDSIKPLTQFQIDSLKIKKNLNNSYDLFYCE